MLLFFHIIEIFGHLQFLFYFYLIHNTISLENSTKESKKKTLEKQVRLDYPKNIFNFSDELYMQISRCRFGEETHFNGKTIYDIIIFGVPEYETNSILSRSILYDFLTDELYIDLMKIYLQSMYIYLNKYDDVIFKNEIKKSLEHFSICKITKFRARRSVMINSICKQLLSQKEISISERADLSRILFFENYLNSYFDLCVNTIPVVILDQKNNKILIFSKEIKIDFKNVLYIKFENIKYKEFLNLYRTTTIIFQENNLEIYRLFKRDLLKKNLILDLKASLSIEYNKKKKFSSRFIQSFCNFLKMINTSFEFKFGIYSKFYKKDNNVSRIEQISTDLILIYFTRYILRNSYKSLNKKNKIGHFKKIFKNYLIFFDFLTYVGNFKFEVHTLPLKITSKDYKYMDVRKTSFFSDSHIFNSISKTLYFFEHYEDLTIFNNSLKNICTPIIFTGRLRDIYLKLKRSLNGIIIDDFYYIQIYDGTKIQINQSKINSFVKENSKITQGFIEIQTTNDLCLYIKGVFEFQNKEYGLESMISYGNKKIWGIRLICKFCNFFEEFIFVYFELSEIIPLVPNNDIDINILNCFLKIQTTIIKQKVFFSAEKSEFYMLKCCFEYEFCIESIKETSFSIEECIGAIKFDDCVLTPNDSNDLPSLKFNYRYNFYFKNYIINGLLQKNYTGYDLEFSWCILEVKLLTEFRKLKIYSSTGKVVIDPRYLGYEFGSMSLVEESIVVFFYFEYHIFCQFESIIFDRDISSAFRKDNLKIVSLKNCSFLNEDHDIIPLNNI